MANETTKSLVGFGDLLGILFMGLKLTHFIDWSWWWVLAPIWLPVSILLVVLAIILIIAGIVQLL
jgi:hypothetical protein